jgi:DNA topoisomerase-1
MRLAQGLYEGGFITYMRTDNVILADDALTAVRSEITTAFGQEFLSTEPRVYKSKVKNAQEAHEAIRPSNVHLTPDKIRHALTPEQFKLYELIWKRTLACQMQAAEIDQTIVETIKKVPTSFVGC